MGTTQEIAESIEAQIAALDAQIDELQQAREKLASAYQHLIDDAASTDGAGHEEEEPAGEDEDEDALVVHDEDARRADLERRRARLAQTPVTPTRTRRASGETRDAVLDALSDKPGEGLTAQDISSATGLSRATVSTTLSKLAAAGTIKKAERGYTV